MKIFTSHLFTIGLVSTISACALNSPNLPSFDELLRESTAQNGRACFRQNDISGWGALEDNVISVSTKNRREYFLITTTFRCESVLSSFQAQFDGASYEVCGGGANRVLTSSESCPIKSVFKFDDRESAFAEYENAENKIASLRKEYERNQVEDD